MNLTDLDPLWEPTLNYFMDVHYGSHDTQWEFDWVHVGANRPGYGDQVMHLYLDDLLGFGNDRSIGSIEIWTPDQPLEFETPLHRLWSCLTSIPTSLLFRSL